MIIFLVLKAVLGGILVIAGFLALITPFTPGSWLALLGFELLGLRVLFSRQFRRWRFVKHSRVLGSRLMFWGTMGIGFLPFILLGIWVAQSRVPGTPRMLVSPSPPHALQQLRVGSHPLTVEIAQTPDEHARGLSGRTSLGEEYGMLFVFSREQERTFWMKDTHIPLDLLWIRDGRVVGITENVQPEPGVPEERLRQYSSPSPVDWVLETNGGWSATHGVRIGDLVALRTQGGEAE